MICDSDKSALMGNQRRRNKKPDAVVDIGFAGSYLCTCKTQDFFRSVRCLFQPPGIQRQPEYSN